MANSMTVSALLHYGIVTAEKAILLAVPETLPHPILHRDTITGARKQSQHQRTATPPRRSPRSHPYTPSPSVRRALNLN